MLKDGDFVIFSRANVMETLGGTVLGLTLRDYFAAACLQSILRHRENQFLPEDDAAWCYRVADAMLAERAK